MIRSMTGYGRSKYQNEGREYIVEIKSVNYKYCDINTRMPYCLNYLEDNLKKLVSENVNRGKIDVIVTFNNNSKLGKNIKKFTAGKKFKVKDADSKSKIQDKRDREGKSKNN